MRGKMKTRLLIACAAAVASSGALRAASVADLLGGKDALQCYRTSGSNDIRCRNLRTGQDWKVCTLSSYPSWTGSINRGGTKLVTTHDNRVFVINLDGSNKRNITTWDTENGYFWRDAQGADWVIYNGELGQKYSLDGSTWRVRIDPATNAPVESTREKILSKHFDSGITRDGRYLGRTYANSYLYDLQTGQMSPHLNGTQNCVASVNPGNEPRMMYEKEPAHHDVVISEWNRSNNTARYIWQYHYGGGEVFGLWSCTDASYAIMRKDQLYLIKLQVDTSGTGDRTGSYQEAATGLPSYVGRLWVGSAPSTVSIDSFTADPTAIDEGDSSTLSWQTSNATSVSINQGIGAVSADGTKQVRPAETTTYTLTAQGTGGPKTRSVTVTVSATPQNTTPTAEIGLPSDGAVCVAGDTLSLQGSATDAEDGSLTGGSLSWEVDRIGDGLGPVYTTTGTSGSYTFPSDIDTDTTYQVKLTATDSGGLADSVTHSITVRPAPADNDAPTVSITQPANNATFAAPADVSVTADAADADGSVAKVDLYLDGSFVRTENHAPYEWSLTGLAEGSHTLTAKATDDDGATTTSAAVTIAVFALREPDSPSGTASGLAVDYYGLSNPSSLPGFGSISPYSSDIVADIDYPSTGDAFATSGRADDVGAVFTGYVEVPSDGLYTFCTESDDGSALYVGSTKVVDNDGLHSMKEASGRIGLRAGLHALRVEFFEAGGGAGLIVRYEGPGVSKKVIPSGAFSHAAGQTNQPPTASASASPTSGEAPLAVDFSGSGSDPEGRALTYAWEFGDGEGSDERSPLHTYASAGTYTATLTVTDEAGASGTDSVQISVTAASGPYVRITSPAGGEVWYAGTTQHITWETDLDDCTILYSVDGSTWDLVDGAGSVDTASPGWLDYEWAVPDLASTQCRVLVKGYFGDCPTKSGVFEIRAVTDSDADGMDDGWEVSMFGDLSHDEATDADGDGLTDYVEFVGGTDPLSADWAVASVGFGCSVCMGTEAGLAALLLGAALLMARHRRMAPRGPRAA